MKALGLVTLFISFNALAWGPTGHRVVGEIAEKHLSSEAALQVYRILGNQTLPRVANWPDEIKSEPQTYSHTYNWHYTDWDDNAPEHNETTSEGKLISAIRDQVAVLKDQSASQNKKAFAIKFLTHLVGDLHQPLHVGNGLDRGGNICQVTFHGKETNLHALWDEGLIDQTKLSFTELSKFIAQGKTKEQIRTWKSGDVMDWAMESKQMRNSLYPNEVNPGSRPLAVKNYCRKDTPKEEMPKLSYEYSYKFVPVMEEQLFKAGLRLASLLNESLKKK